MVVDGLLHIMQTTILLSLADCVCQSPLQLPTQMRGGNGKVAYIDTEGTLYPF